MYGGTAAADRVKGLKTQLSSAFGCGGDLWQSHLRDINASGLNTFIN